MYTIWRFFHTRPFREITRSTSGCSQMNACCGVATIMLRIRLVYHLDTLNRVSSLPSPLPSPSPPLYRPPALGQSTNFGVGPSRVIRRRRQTVTDKEEEEKEKEATEGRPSQIYLFRQYRKGAPFIRERSARKKGGHETIRGGKNKSI